MSNYFQDAGYATNLVGKWHLGYFEKQYTPTMRGFDHFYGYYNGFVDYYNFTYVEQANGFLGYDFRQELEIYKGIKNGSYLTDLLNDEALRIIKNQKKNDKPLFLMLNHCAPHTGNNYDLFQAPQETIDLYAHIEDPERQVQAGK